MARLMTRAVTLSAVTVLGGSSSWISYGTKTIVATNVRYSAQRLANHSPMASTPSSTA